jgi:hypothetical protein
VAEITRTFGPLQRLRPEPLELSGFHRSQDLALGGRRQVGDLVQKQRPAVR